MRGMQSTIDEMHISINEKEAEIIRLNMCLGDEKKRNMQSNNIRTSENTPQRSQNSKHCYNGSIESEVVRNLNIDSPYFKN